MRLGIEGSNLRAGGGVTHLVELLKAADPKESGIDEVVVWSGGATLSQLPQRPWLVPVHAPQLDGALPMRVAWQQFVLPSLAAQTDVMFVPGATPLRVKPPVITLSQNMLPFELDERGRFGWSVMGMKLRVLEHSQTRAFRKANGVVFLTRYAQMMVQRRIGHLSSRQAIIPHGIADAFRCKPRPSYPIHDYSKDHPFRLVYVSIINLYKHQWFVAEAVANLRQAGLPIALDFIGPAYAPALKRLQHVLERVDPARDFIRYLGPISYDKLASYYRGADAFVYASSCENLPIILLEAMASGLPIACSDRGPMPEVLGEAGIYFDPEVITSVESAIKALVVDQARRAHCAAMGFEHSQKYSWERCARETFDFIASMVDRADDL